MTITSVSYKQKYPTGQFLNCDIGFEASVPPGEDPLVVLKQLQDLSESFHKSSFSHLYTESGSPVTFAEPDHKNTRIEMIINDINNCNKVDEINAFGAQVGLIAFEPAANQNPEIKAAYDLKMKQLSTNKN